MNKQLKHKIIATGKLLWDKGLVFGFNGNISQRLDAHTVLITATGTCLGYLTDKDILTMDLKGEVVGKGMASTERLMHTAVYKALPKVQCVLHTHTTYTNGFFLSNDRFTPKTFEARFYLGEVKAVAQTTPSVTDPAPVVDALKMNNIVVLKNHGVVAVGDDLFNAFVLIQELEEQVKMDLVNVHYKKMSFPNVPPTDGIPPKVVTFVGNPDTSISGPPIADDLRCRSSFGGDKNKKYKLFSKEQIEEIVRLVNADAQMQELGGKTAMNMALAVILDETGQAHRFTFENGRITQVAQDAEAEFVINAPEAVWRAVFSRQIDPFVATTQKKMHLKGDFARISKWYAPCSRIFQLWTKVPVE
ncbi:MAG: class II aldolase/adducin family protein [Candidatus Omnitrophica bacterium]|nr:class II aldolase/adducin family protein [Candidatus Omnitrophota bacterium]